MLEAYLFVDPLCNDCFKAEHVILKLANDLDKNFSFQFIPMLNMQIIRNRYLSSGKQLKNEGKNFKVEYGTVLDYKAALFQGRKCGRKFLIGIQKELLHNNIIYSKQIAFKVAEEAGLDLEMFEEDRRSDLAINAFKADQKLANEMNVKVPASAVIFNCDTFESGILMNRVTYSDLLDVCQKNGLLKDTPLIKNGNISPNLHVI
ncbi:DsbA family protein [Nicoliella spurrieriana]|uniref:DsbA family protein n=1 Tax=Nicoliella spurrieriana TaxID=2925830 RepID=A0A976RRG7_9LACO|nr:DsbA family protein [Nicoliella spurrieriana]UQS86424.1 DsbA family protein [Nicoliella spurrieriana]